MALLRCRESCADQSRSIAVRRWCSWSQLRTRSDLFSGGTTMNALFLARSRERLEARIAGAIVFATTVTDVVVPLLLA